MKTEQICLAAIKQNPKSDKYIPDHLLKHVQELYLNKSVDNYESNLPRQYSDVT